MVPGEPAPALRICFFNRSYYPDFGATGQLLTELAEDLAQRHGCHVTIIAGLPSYSSLPRIHIRRQRHHGVEIRRAWGTAFRPTRFAGRAANYASYFFSACLAALTVPRPDVVVFLTDPPIIGLAALLAARRSGAKLVFLCQDVFPEVTQLLEDFHSKAVNRILHQISRFLIRTSERVVAVGDTMRNRLIAEKGADPRRVKVIHNWADCSVIAPTMKKNSFSVSNGLADCFVVMHSGNMGLSQELETLVQAASHLKNFPDIRVVLVGDGVKKQALENLAHTLELGNTLFIPYQLRENLKDSFASADAFVVSLKRGLAGYIVPSKLYGILAAGRPYVAAVEEECEVTAITREYDCGLLAEPGNAEDLAQKILTLYRDRSLTQRLGENARKAAARFDRSVGVKAYWDLFRSLRNPQCPP